MNSAPPSLIDANGRPISLDRQLGSLGGEGTVFALSADINFAAKVYHNPPTPQKVEKLVAMIGLANSELSALTAWPKALLYHARTKQPAGFLMPRFSDCQPIWHLYNPVQRLRCFPRAGWDFQVRAARNLAATFDEIHRTGCLMGDVNEKNEFVSPQALVRLIDCDSFQVRASGKCYPCEEVAVALYLPPELQGKSLRGIVRTENHDRFGLAVLIYQLLFVGRHPYAGVYRGSGDPSFEQLIAEFRFAQGPAAQNWGMAPPPHTPTFADIPSGLGNLFRRAFERGSEAGTRPRPTEWLAALEQLEHSLVECAADTGHKYWRGAHSCVWCRLADRGGPEYFFGVAAGASSFAVDEAKLQEVLRRFNACGTMDFPYARDRFMPPRLPEPEELPEGLEEHRNTAIILGVAIGLCLLGIPFGLIHGAFCIGGFLGALIFGAWLGIHIALSPWHREYRRRRVAWTRARHRVEELEGEWEQAVKRYHRSHSESSRTLQRLVSECRGLTSKYQIEQQRLAANAEATARIRHLRLYLIADAEIPNIGAGRKQLLASNGIFTAEDIEDHRIRGIKGFGDKLTNTLLTWKGDVLRQFRFDPATAISPAEQRSITVKLRNAQQQFLAELSRQIEQIESLAPGCQAKLQKLSPELKRAGGQYKQAEADLNLIAGKR